MSYDEAVTLISLEAAQDISDKQFYAVKLDSNGRITPCVFGDMATGILQNNPGAIEAPASIAISGISKAIVGGPVSTWDPLVVDNSSRFIYGVGNIVARALRPASSTDEIISVLMTKEGSSTAVSNGCSRVSNWFERTSAVDEDFHGVAAGTSRLVLVSSGTGSGQILTSESGAGWVVRSSYSYQLRDVTFDTVSGSSLYVAVGSSDLTNAQIFTSSDALTWTQRTTGVPNFSASAVAGNGSNLWTVGGSSGYIITSPDGINWTTRLGPDIFTSFKCAHYANGLWVVGGSSGGINPRIYTSPDGITWTQRFISNVSEILGVTYGNGIWVCVGYRSELPEKPKIFKSTDAITWTETSPPLSYISAENIYDVAFGNDRFVLVGKVQDSRFGLLAVSSDGTNWTIKGNDKPSVLRSITFDERTGSWIAVGDTDGTDGYILQSLACP